MTSNKDLWYTRQSVLISTSLFAAIPYHLPNRASFTNLYTIIYVNSSKRTIFYTEFSWRKKKCTNMFLVWTTKMKTSKLLWSPSGISRPIRAVCVSTDERYDITGVHASTLLFLDFVYCLDIQCEVNAISVKCFLLLLTRTVFSQRTHSAIADNLMAH